MNLKNVFLIVSKCCKQEIYFKIIFRKYIILNRYFDLTTSYLKTVVGQYSVVMFTRLTPTDR